MDLGKVLKEIEVPWPVPEPAREPSRIDEPLPAPVER